MGMAAILFKGTEPFKQIIYTLSTEGPMWNMVKIARAVSEKNFKNYTYVHSPGVRADSPRGQNLIVTKQVLTI